MILPLCAMLPPPPSFFLSPLPPPLPGQIDPVLFGVYLSLCSITVKRHMATANLTEENIN